MSSRLLYALAFLVGGFAGCFTEEPVACPLGTNGCPCGAETTCVGALVCNDDANCISPDCEEGAALCPCYGNGTCNGALMCMNKICHPAAGQATSVNDSAADVATATSAPTTSASSSGDISVDSSGTVGASGIDPATADTSGSSTGQSATGSSTGPNCELQGSAMMTYGGCPKGACPFEQACVPLADGGAVCAPQGCAKTFECQGAQPGGGTVTCIDGNCLLVCGPGDGPECPNGPGFGDMQCYENRCGFPTCPDQADR